ncbi:MAG: hypothetical protein ACR2QV_04235 [Gammaproteobacteria bacterium]
MIVMRNTLLPAVATLLLVVSTAQAAEQDTVQAVIPWEAEGQVFQVDTNTMLFLGSLKGVMYIESSRGEMHEAFVQCPVMQELDMESGKTEATGRCEITASDSSVAYAELSCKGEVGNCDGKFKLTSGAGELAGISGSGNLRIRSPMRALIADMGSGAILRVGAGLAVIKDLKYRIP